MVEILSSDSEVGKVITSPLFFPSVVDVWLETADDCLCSSSKVASVASPAESSVVLV